VRHGWLASLIGRAMATYVRLVAATSRVTGLVSQEPVVLAFWHEYNLVAAVAAQRRRRHRYHVSFSTQTFRGAVMDAMLSALGAGSVPLPAPADRAGSARLSLELARLGREGASPGVSPDGPIGPYRRAKPGALLVARESGLPIRPWAVSARPSFRLTRRWDRHIVPLPFSRIRVHEAPPIEVPPRVPLRPLQARLQESLDAMAARADRDRRTTAPRDG
jgi:lysophospholipid acyltransferase (LPLAT)-like uncharacterized protein